MTDLKTALLDKEITDEDLDALWKTIEEDQMVQPVVACNVTAGLW